MHPPAPRRSSRLAFIAVVVPSAFAVVAPLITSAASAFAGGSSAPGQALLQALTSLTLFTLVLLAFGALLARTAATIILGVIAGVNVVAVLLTAIVGPAHTMVTLVGSLFWLCVMILGAVLALRDGRRMPTPGTSTGFWIAAAAYVLGPPITLAVMLFSMTGSVRSMMSIVPSLLTGVLTVVVVVLASMPSAWSRFVAAGGAAILALASSAQLLSLLVISDPVYVSSIVPSSIVVALGWLAAAALLVTAAVLHQRQPQRPQPL